MLSSTVIYSDVQGINVNAPTQLAINLKTGFADSVAGTQNFTHNVTITPPGVITEAALNLRTQEAISAYVNATYGLSTSPSDVVLWGGVSVV